MGCWCEVFNIDVMIYYGLGIGNFGGVDVIDDFWYGCLVFVVLVLLFILVLWLMFV